MMSEREVDIAANRRGSTNKAHSPLMMGGLKVRLDDDRWPRSPFEEFMRRFQ